MFNYCLYIASFLSAKQGWFVVHSVGQVGRSRKQDIHAEKSYQTFSGKSKL